MARKKVYWPGLLRVAKLACKYWKKWRPYLPNDLPPEVKVAFDAMQVACDLLILYDRNNPRGKGV